MTTMTPPRTTHSDPATEQTTGQTTPVLVVRTLGAFAVTLDGRSVDTGGSRRDAAVLAYLITHRKSPVHADVLLDTFWPTAAPAAARNSMHVALSGIRRALRAVWPEPLLLQRSGAYTLSPAVDVWVDVEEFERLSRVGRAAEDAGRIREAVAAYTGADELYEGDFLSDQLYTEWTGPNREYFRLQAIDVLVRLAELHSRLGEPATATRAARRCLLLDPCHEIAHRALMTCYASAGQVYLALAQYRRCADALWRAFRVPPSPETTRLYRRLQEPTTRIA